MKLSVWEKINVLSREFGPPLENRSQPKKFVFGRIGNSAIIWLHSNGEVKSIVFYQDNAIHRNSGPAIESYSDNGRIQTQEHLQKGMLHRSRIEGPAFASYDDSGKVRLIEFWERGHYIPAPLNKGTA
jgi:hypothetical protein